MAQTNKQKLQNGFTLLEALVVIAIVSIIAALAVSSFESWSSESSTRSALAKFRSSLVTARMEAITRGNRIVMCGSTSGENCNSEFEIGWILFQDINSNSVRDDDETIVATEELDTNRLSLTVTDPEGNTLTQIPFNFRGNTFVIADVTGAQGSFSTNFTVNRLGKISSH